MISLSTIIPATPGNIVLHNAFDSTLKDNAARSTLVPTLDGGAVLIHSGVSENDKKVSIKAKVNKSQEEILWSFFNGESVLLMSSTAGFYQISIKSIKSDNGNLSMSIYIISKEI